jgi:hypothetical protein
LCINAACAGLIERVFNQENFWVDVINYGAFSISFITVYYFKFDSLRTGPIF